MRIVIGHPVAVATLTEQTDIINSDQFLVARFPMASDAVSILDPCLLDLREKLRIVADQIVDLSLD